MFTQQFPQSTQPMRLQFPTHYHIQQQQQQQQQHTQQPMPMNFTNHHQNPNNAATPNNSYAGTIDPGLLQMTMNHPQLQHMNPLFPSSSASPINALGNNTNNNNNHPAALGRSGFGSKRNSNSNTVKQEAGSPDFLASEMEFGEPSNMLSPGSSSPLNSPRNDFDSPDDFGSGNGGSAIASHAKPVPVNIQHPGSY
ncbi:hypothetical protein BGZ65_011662, partial [Modicella reniformis]